MKISTVTLTGEIWKLRVTAMYGIKSFGIHARLLSPSAYPVLYQRGLEEPSLLDLVFARQKSDVNNKIQSSRWDE